MNWNCAAVLQKPCIFSGKKKIKKNTAYKSDISWYYTISDYLQILHQYWLVEEVKYLL